MSLNDTLLTGPSLNPLLTDVLIQFRQHRIGFSADISKNIREILLHESERDLHRFLLCDETGAIRDHRMCRLTFGVKSSPYLANQFLRHLSVIHKDRHPEASEAIQNYFYVDDFLSGTETIEDVVHLLEQLYALLKLVGMNLHKWRTRSREFRDTIPSELIETEDLILSESSLKALGIHWNVQKDCFYISTSSSDYTITTKRTIASDSARVYDILGLFSPFTIVARMIKQSLCRGS